jgi:hypothetical protein
MSEISTNALIAELRKDAGDYALFARNIPTSHELSWGAENVRAWLAADALEAATVPTENEREALAERVEEALDAEMHDDLCACRDYPERCVTYGALRPWTHSDVHAVVQSTLTALEGSRLPVPVEPEQDMRDAVLDEVFTNLSNQGWSVAMTDHPTKGVNLDICDPNSSAAVPVEPENGGTQ